ncbi:MAG: hypothetical protein FWD31_02510 [Planctomycetaceae bacterium]|nr:hypothetical protein [Planctomycetaceae bacterium]
MAKKKKTDEIPIEGETQVDTLQGDIATDDGMPVIDAKEPAEWQKQTARCFCGTEMTVVKPTLKSHFDVNNKVTYTAAVECVCPKCRLRRIVETGAIAQ